MVAETHPHDIELFEYVENELPPARRDEIAAHLATCTVCAEQVELAALGRESLRGTALLELPDQRREEILRNLPRQERAPGEQRTFSPKLVFAGLVALLLVAAVIGVIVNSNGGGGMESSAGGTAAEDATAAGGGEAGGSQVQSPQAKAGLFSTGPAEEVAEELRRKGFKASVQQDRVVVRGATKQQVREALADRAPGDVEVVVKNP
jgi:anti-sigma factor RsiW